MPTEARTRKTTYQTFLWLLALAVACAAAIWLVKQIHPPAVRIVAPLLAIIVMGCSLLLGSRVQRTLDEVQVASQSAANHKGTSLGAMLAIGLLMLPPVGDALADLIYTLTKVSPDVNDRVVVQLALVFGAVLVMLTQTVITAIAAVVWWRRAGGGSERP